MIFSARLRNGILPRVVRAVAGMALLLAGAASAGVISNAQVYYAFEDSGQIVEDRSGGADIDLQLGSTSGADSADPTRLAGKVGGGLSFDGGDFATSIADVGELDFAPDEAFSVAGWFQRSVSTGGTQEFLVSKMNPSGAFPGWFLTWRDEDIGSNNNSLLFFIRDDQGGTGDGFLAVYSDPVAETDWIHAAVTYDGSSDPSGVSFYLDGQSLGIRNTNDDLDAGDVTDNTAPFNIGGRNDGGSWEGLVDEVGVWDRELTRGEVQRAMSGIPEPGSAALLVVAFVGLLGQRAGRG